jgi:hypothetical protein
MPYIVKCTYIIQDEEGNTTYYEGSGITCFSKESAEDTCEYLINKSNVKDVVIKKV